MHTRNVRSCCCSLSPGRFQGCPRATDPSEGQACGHSCPAVVAAVKLTRSYQRHTSSCDWRNGNNLALRNCLNNCQSQWRLWSHYLSYISYRQNQRAISLASQVLRSSQPTIKFHFWPIAHNPRQNSAKCKCCAEQSNIGYHYLENVSQHYNLLIGNINTTCHCK